MSLVVVLQNFPSVVWGIPRSHRILEAPFHFNQHDLIPWLTFLSILPSFWKTDPRYRNRQIFKHSFHPNWPHLSHFLVSHWICIPDIQSYFCLAQSHEILRYLATIPSCFTCLNTISFTNIVHHGISSWIDYDEHGKANCELLTDSKFQWWWDKLHTWDHIDC